MPYLDLGDQQHWQTQKEDKKKPEAKPDLYSQPNVGKNPATTPRRSREGIIVSEFNHLYDLQETYEKLRSPSRPSQRCLTIDFNGSARGTPPAHAGLDMPPLCSSSILAFGFEDTGMRAKLEPQPQVHHFRSVSWQFKVKVPAKFSYLGVPSVAIGGYI